MSVRALIKAHEDYRSARAKLKEIQRVQLEIDLAREKENLGQEIAILLNEGMNIVEITTYLGLKNRNYTYDMLRAYTKEAPRAIRKVVQQKIDETEETVTPWQWTRNGPVPDENGYKVQYYQVVVGNNKYNLKVVDGTPTPPDEWAEDTAENRAIYKQIIAEVRADVNRITS